MVKKVFPGLLIFFCLFFTSTVTVSAKNYVIKKVDFDVKLDETGDANVTETRTYQFNGSFLWADVRLGVKGGRAIEDVMVSDENGPLRIEQNNEADQLYLKWYYSAVNQTKIFTLNYKIRNAQTDHPDIREFYWQLITDKWDQGSEEVNARIYLPTPAPNNQIWVFGHGPLNGKVQILTDQEVDLSAANLPSRRMFEVRVLYPKSGTKLKYFDPTTLAQILMEEKGFGEKTTADRRKQQVWTIVEIATAGLILTFVIFRLGYWAKKWWQTGRDLPVPEVNLAGTLHEPPSDLDPGMVETLLAWNMKPTGKAITATVINLIRKKAVIIKSEKQNAVLGLFPQEDKYILVWNSGFDRVKLTPLESDLFGFLFISETGGMISMDAIKNMGRTRPIETQKFWKDWQKASLKNLVTEGFLEEGNYRDSESIDKESGVFIGIGVCCMYLAFNLIPEVLILGLVMIPFTALCFIAGSVLTGLKVAMQKRTGKGNQEYANWKAFKKYITDYSVTKNYPIDSVILWEKYLVYGAALGVSVKALSQLPVNYAETFQSSGLYAGFYGGSAFSQTDFSANISNMFNGFSSMSSGFSHFGASGVGGSGGFSGGGGGGGGAAEAAGAPVSFAYL